MLLNRAGAKINTWKQFARRVRSGGCNLLATLDEFPRSVLVAGCQRSGTTILARTITSSDGMVNYRFGKDDELDAALILSGYVEHRCSGRYCFQTTYLNECYHEYYKYQKGHKIIWVVRNPFSVVYSLVYHWKRFAFNELFDSCGARYMSKKECSRYNKLGALGIHKLRRACYSYNAKTDQLFELYERLGGDSMLVVDYDDITQRKEEWLPKVYKFIDQPYKTGYSSNIHDRSVNKAKKLSTKQRDFVEEISMPVYEKAKKLIL